MLPEGIDGSIDTWEHLCHGGKDFVFVQSQHVRLAKWRGVSGRESDQCVNLCSCTPSRDCAPIFDSREESRSRRRL